MPKVTNQRPPHADEKINLRRKKAKIYCDKIREKRREWQRKWVKKNPMQFTIARVRSNARRRIAVLRMYADPIRCQSCGFNEIDGLVLDHINDDGVAHRKKLGISCRGNSGGKIIYEVIRQKGKIDGLQVLCANCNTMKHVRRLRRKTLHGEDSVVEEIEKLLRDAARGR